VRFLLGLYTFTHYSIFCELFWEAELFVKLVCIYVTKSSYLPVKVNTFTFKLFIYSSFWLIFWASFVRWVLYWSISFLSLLIYSNCCFSFDSLCRKASLFASFSANIPLFICCKLNTSDANLLTSSFILLTVFMDYDCYFWC